MKTKLKEKEVFILVNLGSPDSPKVSSVRKYLFEFLMDPCVIDINFFSRLLLVGGIIAPFRSFSSAKAYKEIWKKEGSPLILNTKDVQEKLQRKTKALVLIAMRYGNPSIRFSIEKAIQYFNGDIGKITFVPLYPHFALSTTTTVYREIKRCMNKKLKQFNNLSYKITKVFYNNEQYIEVLSQSIKPYLKDLEKEENHLLFSYHGVPERHILKTANKEIKPYCLSEKDCCEKVSNHETCYRYQVLKTTELVVEKLEIKDNKYSVAFQSRLGRSPWLTPYTVEEVERLGRQGIKKLLVVCPAFVSDNLETLFEIEIENEEVFKENKGEEIKLIPCLNDRDEWINFLQTWIYESDDFKLNIKNMS